LFPSKTQDIESKQIQQDLLAPKRPQCPEAILSPKMAIFE
jgi:hypothetical protein